MNIIAHANMIIDTVRPESDEIILMYSGGKDSQVLLDMLTKKFNKVHACFMYLVEGLEHQERFLRMAERVYPNVQVHRMPHYGLSIALRHGQYCNPHPGLRLIKLADIEKAMRKRVGEHWICYGMKKVDSLNRNLMLRNYELEGITRSSRKIYPLSLWKQTDCLSYIKKRKLMQPVNYGLKSNSSGMALDGAILHWLKENYPDDLRKVLAVFPHAEKLLFDFEYHKNKKQNEQRNEVPKV
jgi:3'-phosphoadenosine 5'-phosphosulfate sulfotransferase (PAPS reductase)/FAD synthetase